MQRRIYFFISVILCIAVQGVGAFTFAPISWAYDTKGKGSSHVYTITNDSRTEKIAVKVSVFSRIVDEEGRELLEPCPGDFVIYPSRSILDPGEKKSVRIKWQGGDFAGKEKAYRVIAEQLPVEFKPEETGYVGAGIRFTYRYEGSLYVVPSNAEERIELVSLVSESIVTEEPGMTEITRMNDITGETELVEVEETTEVSQSWLKLTFENSGTRHVLLAELNLTLTSPYNNFEPIFLEPSDLKGVVGENILAGNRRSFLIPEPAVVQGEELEWSFSFKPIY
jgi:fimbrial chaperone protein